MNREQILAMDTKQLKRAVAEHIMGYSVYHYDKDYEANCYFMLVDPEGEYQQLERKTEDQAWDDAPDFPTDVAAAWSLLEMFQIVEVNRTEIFESQVTHTVQISVEYEPLKYRKVFAIDRDLGVAACRAALIATLDPRGGDAE